jgi:hypothetical protein
VNDCAAGENFAGGRRPLSLAGCRGANLRPRNCWSLLLR